MENLPLEFKNFYENNLSEYADEQVVATSIEGVAENDAQPDSQNVVRCTIDAFAHVNSTGSFTPTRDGIIGGNPYHDWGCRTGEKDWYNFGKIFAERSEYYFPDNRDVINCYEAKSVYNFGIPKNFCRITIDMLPGKTCSDLKFGGDDVYVNYFVDSSGNKISYAVSSSIFESCKFDSIPEIGVPIDEGKTI